MARLAIFDGAGHLEFFGAGFDEAQAAIDGKQFGAEAQHGDVDGFATACTKMILGCGEHLFAQTGALVRGINCKLTEVTAIAVGFCVDGGEDLAGGVFGEEDIAFLHHGGESFLVGAGAFEEGFDGEGCVDEGNEARAICGGSEADLEDGRIGHDSVEGCFNSSSRSAVVRAQRSSRSGVRAAFDYPRSHSSNKSRCAPRMGHRERWSIESRSYRNRGGGFELPLLVADPEDEVHGCWGSSERAEAGSTLRAMTVAVEGDLRHRFRDRHRGAGQCAWLDLTIKFG